MNIFYLSNNLEKCARYHADKHVVKMILEYAQILCTANNLTGVYSPYKSTHKNHPCVKWVMESLDNWLWLRELSKELNIEYQYRFSHIRNHKSYDVIASLELPNLDSNGVTDHPQCMPEILQIPNDPIQAYRLYYLTEKKSLLKWSRRSVPSWVLGGYKVILNG